MKVVTLVACIMLSLPLVASADTDSLAGQWSNSSNPNGNWSFHEGDNLLLMREGWLIEGIPNPTWSPVAYLPGGHNFLPMLFRAEFPLFDWQAGDIVMHARDEPNGTGNGECTVVWTAPNDGFIAITGHSWMVRDIQRSIDVALNLNCFLIARGDLFTGDPNSRANPMLFSDIALTPLADLRVRTGDRLVLDIRRDGGLYGDYVGLSLEVEFSAAATGCLADFDHSGGQPEVPDIFAFLAAWFQLDIRADLDDTPCVGVSDIFQFLSLWFAGC